MVNILKYMKDDRNSLRKSSLHMKTTVAPTVYMDSFCPVRLPGRIKKTVVFHTQTISGIFSGTLNSVPTTL